MFLYVVSLEQNRALVGVSESPAAALKELPTQSAWVARYPIRELLAIQSVNQPYTDAVNKTVVSLVRENCNADYARGTVGEYTAVELPPAAKSHLQHILLTDCEPIETPEWDHVHEIVEEVLESSSDEQISDLECYSEDSS
jgi:hypothetical protein